MKKQHTWCTRERVLIQIAPKCLVDTERTWDVLSQLPDTYFFLLVGSILNVLVYFDIQCSYMHFCFWQYVCMHLVSASKKNVDFRRKERDKQTHNILGWKDCNWLMGECDFNRMSQNGLSVEVPFIGDLDEVKERAMWLSGRASQLRLEQMQRASGMSSLGNMRNCAADRTTRAERRLWKYIGEVTSGQMICLKKNFFYWRIICFTEFCCVLANLSLNQP